MKGLCLEKIVILIFTVVANNCFEVMKIRIALDVGRHSS